MGKIDGLISTVPWMIFFSTNGQRSPFVVRRRLRFALLVFSDRQTELIGEIFWVWLVFYMETVLCLGWSVA